MFRVTRQVEQWAWTGAARVGGEEKPKPPVRNDDVRLMQPSESGLEYPVIVRRNPKGDGWDVVKQLRPVKHASDDDTEEWHSPAERQDWINRLRQTRPLRGFRQFEYFHGVPTADLIAHYHHPAAPERYRSSLAGELGSRAVGGDPEALEASKASDLGSDPEYQWYFDDAEEQQWDQDE